MIRTLLALCLGAVVLGGCTDPAARLAAQDAQQQQLAGTRQAAELQVIYRTPLPPDYKAQIDRYFAATLRDPPSRRVTFVATPKGSIVCGTVNARNGFGGYNGAQPFVAWFRPDGALADIETLSWDDLHWALSGPANGAMLLDTALFNRCGFAG